MITSNLVFYFFAQDVTKAHLHKIEEEVPKNFLAAPKMVSFFSAAGYKKGHHFCAARRFFGPSYFVTALAHKLLTK